MEPKQLESGKPRGKCRKWQLRVNLGLNPKTGKYSYKTKTFKGTYRQAIAATESFESEVKNLFTSQPGRKLTFEELSQEYVKHRVDMQQIADSTADKIRHLLNAMSYHIGKMPADKIDPYMVQDAVKSMLAGDSAKDKPLSGTYVNMIIMTCKTMYNRYAIPQSLATSNPFEKIEHPKDDTEERKPLTEDQQESLIAEACNHMDHRYAAVMMALLGGLRAGETRSIKWQNIDLVDGIIYLPETKGSKTLTATPIQESLVIYLLEWKEKQRNEMASYGVIQDDNTYICSNALGDQLKKDTLGRWWRRNRSRLGCDDAHFHDLRHTFATELAKRDTHPKTIQGLLRQKDDRISMRIYTHVNTSQMQDAVRNLGKKI